MTQTPPIEGVVTKRSAHSFDATVDRLLGIIDARGLTLFTVVDHTGEARKVGLLMADTKVVVFGSPVAGTPVMLAAPLAALDLPLKVLVWAGADGAVSVSYNAPAYLASRYHLTDELRARLAAIDTITDATVAPIEGSP